MKRHTWKKWNLGRAISTGLIGSLPNTLFWFILGSWLGIIFLITLQLMTFPVRGGTLIDIDREEFYDDLWEGYKRSIIEKNMEDSTPAKDSINSALEDYWEKEHGSNGSTKSEELLQLSSDGDQQSFGWGYDRRNDRSWFRSLQEGESASSRCGHTRKEDS